jgi:hypothetical protein
LADHLLEQHHVNVKLVELSGDLGPTPLPCQMETKVQGHNPQPTGTRSP